MKQRILSAFLAVVMVISLLPMSVFAADTIPSYVPTNGGSVQSGDVTIKGPHIHDNLTFTEWTETSGTVSTSGNYYLADNITATGNIIYSKVVINLCLNGKKLNLNGHTIEVKEGATLNICDCQSTETEGHIDSSSGLWKPGSGEKTANLVGGVIYGSTASAVKIKIATFNMSGGNIAGNTGDLGGGVLVDYDATFNMSGGSILYNSAYHGGGVCQFSTMNITGEVDIRDNKATEWGNNLYLGGNKIVTVSAKPKNPIGISTYTLDEESSPADVTSENNSDISSYFFSDRAGYRLVNGENNVVQLEYGSTHTHSDGQRYEAISKSNFENMGGGQVAIYGDFVCLDENLIATQDIIINATALCLNGYTFDLGNYTLFGSRNITICDCCKNPGKITSENSSKIKNHGILTLADGAQIIGDVTITNELDRTLNITGGVINLTETANIDNEGTLNMSGGSVTGIEYGIKNTGTIYLSGSPVINGTQSDIYLETPESKIYANDGTSKAYTGTDEITITLASAVKVGDVVVYGVTDSNKGKFTVTDSTYKLKKSGDNLILAYSDETPHTGEIKIGDNGWFKFWYNVSFGMFCKDYVEIEITGEDAETGVATIEYYLSDTAINDEDIKGITAWTAYTGKVRINAERKVFVYAKITDNAGNVAYISVDGGIVVYTDSEQDTTSVTYTLTTNNDTVVNVTLNGNTVKSIALGGNEIDTANYTVDTNGKIALKGTYLNTLSATDTPYTFTVAYNPMGETYVEAEDNKAPITTNFEVLVEKAEGKVEIITPISKTYDGTPVEEPRYEKQSIGEVKFEYKVKGADDSTYTTTAPIDAGEYTVRVTVASDSFYKEAFDTSDFVIQKKPLSVMGISWDVQSSPFTYDGTEKSVTLIGTLPTGVTVEKTGNTAANAGSYTAVATFKFAEGYADGNYEIFGATDNKVSADWAISPKVVTPIIEVADGGIYDGTEKKPTVVVKDGDVVIPVSEYTVAYIDNINAGTATVTITDNKGGNYTVNGNENFNITKADYPAVWLKNLVGNHGDKLSTIALTEGFTWDNPDEIIKYGNGHEYAATYTPTDTDNYKVANGSITVNGADVTAPTGTVTIGENSWNTLWNDITFGLFFKETQTVTVTAEDTESGITKTEYYLAANKISDFTDVQWTAFNGGFAINPDNKYVVYICITNGAGYKTVINSDGVVLDSIVPVISGIENGKDIYGDATFTVDDDNLDSVTVDGNNADAVDGKYTIAADNAEHTVVVTDQSGNSTEYKLTVYKNYTVTFVIDGKEITKQVVGHGKDATLPEIPAKDGYTAKWNADGKNITADITITAEYTEIPETDSPQTGDNSNMALWVALLFISGIGLVGTTVYGRKRRTN